MKFVTKEDNSVWIITTISTPKSLMDDFTVLYKKDKKFKDEKKRRKNFSRAIRTLMEDYVTKQQIVALKKMKNESVSGPGPEPEQEQEQELESETESEVEE